MTSGGDMDGAEEKRLAGRLGKRIAAARLNADMTQQQLAEMLGVGDEAVSRIERGAVMLTMPKLFDIADALRMRVDELLLGASSRVDDQAMAVAQRIAQLSAADREFAVEMVERLAQHLRPKPADKRSRR